MGNRTGDSSIGWFGIVRLGLVQAAMGAVFVLGTSTMNRIMVVELALPALVPGILVAIQYGVQVLRPCLGYGSDLGGRRTPWIIGGMAVLALGGSGAGLAAAWMSVNLAAGIALALVAFVLIGLGFGAAGTSLLVLLAKRVENRRKPAAAALVWVMMIAGIAITAGTAGSLLDPFSFARLVAVTTGVCAVALVLATVAVWRIEGPHRPLPAGAAAAAEGSLRAALTQVWREPRARRFAIFVFLSMLGYSAQELILEPFAGALFHLSPGESAKLTSVQHGGALIGMILFALAGSAVAVTRFGSMRFWTIGGCVASAMALLALALGGVVGTAWPLRPNVFLLGVANGVFAVSAVGSMMRLAGEGRESREGVRMGIWGAAQAVAFALGGLFATSGSDLMHLATGSSVAAYAAVFVAEAALFLVAARWAGKVFEAASPRPAMPVAGAALAGR